MTNQYYPNLASAICIKDVMAGTEETFSAFCTKSRSADVRKDVS